MKVLVIQGDQVVTALNHPDRGEAFPIIASLLLDPTFESIYVAGANLYPCLARINFKMKDAVGWRMRISNPSKRHPIPMPNGGYAYRGTFYVDYFCIDQRSSSKRNNGRYPRRRIEVINLERFNRH